MKCHCGHDSPGRCPDTDTVTETDNIDQLVTWQLGQNPMQEELPTSDHSPTPSRFGCACGASWVGNIWTCPECGAEAVAAEPQERT